MKKLLFVALILYVVACQEVTTTPPTSQGKIDFTQHEIDSVLQKFKFRYEQPVIIKDSEYVLIPISTQLLKSRSKFSKDGYQVADFPRYWNMLFYNRKTGDTRLLTEDKYRISDFQANIETTHYVDDNINYEQVSNELKGKILYTITDTDYNGDDKLNYEDPEHLFVSDIDGTNLKRISPDNEDLSSYNIIPNSNQIILQTLRDTNKDAKFDHQDEYVWYKTEIVDDNWEIVEMIDPIKRKNIENLYFEQWLKNR